MSSTATTITTTATADTTKGSFYKNMNGKEYRGESLPFTMYIEMRESLD
jgi:hypothetical protein